MKKLLALLFTTLLVLSCSTDDGGNTNITNPPNNDLQLVRMDVGFVGENAPYQILEYDYDTNGRVVKITASNSDGTGTPFTSDYEYQDGLVVNISFSDGTDRSYTYQNGLIVSSESNGTTWEYGYDTFGRLETITTTIGGSDTCVTTYTYGNSSQPSESINDCTGETTSYTYDDKRNPLYYLFHASFSKVAPYTPNNISGWTVTGLTNETNYTTTINYNSEGWPTGIQYFSEGTFVNANRFYYE